MKTNPEVADVLENFLSGRRGKWDWSNFISFPIADSYLEGVLCASLPDLYPPTIKGHYCSDDGTHTDGDGR